MLLRLSFGTWHLLLRRLHVPSSGPPGRDRFALSAQRGQLRVVGCSEALPGVSRAPRGPRVCCSRADSSVSLAVAHQACSDPCSLPGRQSLHLHPSRAGRRPHGLREQRGAVEPGAERGEDPAVGGEHAGR